MLLLLLGLTFTPIKEVHVHTLEINRYLFETQGGIVGFRWESQLVAFDSDGRFIAGVLLEGDAPEVPRSPMIICHFGTVYKIHYKQLRRTWSIEDPFTDVPFGNLFGD